MSDDRCFRCFRDICACTCKCSFCKEPMVDCTEFEAGNNAEFPVEVYLCEEHHKEFEKDEYAFQDKYGAKIDDMAYEHLVDSADTH